MAFVAKKRLYLTADNRVVEDGDPEAAFLLTAAGVEVPPDVVRKYGLSDEVEEPERKALEEPPSNKAITEPPETKHRKPKKTDGE